MNTCGQCRWAKSVPQDLRIRVCMFGPPQLVVIPTPQGMQIAPMRPSVTVNEEAPSCFETGVYGEAADPV
jgi:hypothetical protein